MAFQRSLRTAAAAALSVALLIPQIAMAKPSLAHMGGGGARPATGRPMGGGGGRGAAAARPALANKNRPQLSNLQRPNVPGVSQAQARPARPNNVSRPTLSGLPSTARPNPTRPNPTRPNPLPGANARPVSKLPPSVARPTTRPAPLPSRPNFVNPDRENPGIASRPSTRPVPLPSTRPSTRPTTRPARPEGERPNFNRPGGIARPLPQPINPRPDRPVTLPAERPSLGISTRPTRPTRPIDRPVINRPGQPDGNAWVNNRPTTLPATLPAHRPGTRPNHRPGDGWYGGSNHWHHHHDWTDNWYHHHVHDHYHHWYHGCWSGHRGAYWYVPMTVGATAWGLNGLTSWSYAGNYYNPYYVVSTTSIRPTYDYSQPLVINNYANSNNANSTESVTEPATNSAVDEATELVEEARLKFYEQQYAAARDLCERALAKSPQDPVIHELRALCLFALGDYNLAAATLNSLLASAPGMDWTTMSSLYAESSTYTQQLRQLERRTQQQPDDAAAAFVLAYHYLVLGEQDSAVSALQRVVTLQPRDATAKRMLESLEPPKASVPDKPVPADQAPNESASMSLDLVGNWQATANETTIELTVDENSQFQWTAHSKGQDDVTLSGQLAATSSAVILDSSEQGVLVATVTPQSPDQFRFAIQGAPSSDPGLTFVRK